MSALDIPGTAVLRKPLSTATQVHGSRRFMRVLRTWAPSIATLLLATLLVGTIFLTNLDWQWVAFLSGILFAAVLSLVSSSWKSAWRLGRRTAEARRFKTLYADERGQRQMAAKALEAELALHREDSLRLARAAAGVEAAEVRARAATSLLATLAHELGESAFVVDRGLRYRFHTRGFAAWAHAQPVRIDGRPFDEPLRPLLADALKPLLTDALAGKSSRMQLDDGAPDAAGKRFAAIVMPHYEQPHLVTGALVRIMEISPIAVSEAAALSTAPQVSIGAAAQYVDLLTAELTGWENPQARIREALKHDGFDLFVQDIVALHEGVRPAVMREVLIRMRDEERDLIPPGAFLPIAERAGLMGDIDRLVVAKSIAALKAADENDTVPVATLCLNLSRTSIEDRGFAEFVAGTLAHAPLPAIALCFEFSDGDVLAVPAEAARLAHELKAIGCTRSLAGFGVSSAAFDRLKTVPTEFVKIDSRIIYAMTQDPAAAAKVKAIQRVCRSIGVRTIAELVESEATLAMLREIGVDYAQGFGVARPRPMAAEI